MGKSNKFSLTSKSHASTRVNPYDKRTLNPINVTCPKHVALLPKLSGQGQQQMFIELQSLFIFVIALGTQYLNLYRSTWWLSKSTSQAMNYHLIDTDVSQFSLLFIGQSSLISIINGRINHWNIYEESTMSAVAVTTIAATVASWLCNIHLLKCAYRIWNEWGTSNVICILVPIFVSILMNSTHIIQVVESCRKTGKIGLSFLTLYMTLFCHVKFDDDKLCHVCSNQPDEIREEVDKLRTIFNERLKFIIFKSILIAYYSSFVPLNFTQTYLYYDVSWTAQHVAITWFSALIMLISCSYTPHFYDVLHRSAYHFGKWQKLEARNTLVPCISWSESAIYPQGVVVKHSKGYFRSESVSNCAQPGSSSHLRYYIVFSNPKIGFSAALALLGSLITVQMYLLLISSEWYKLISLTLMMLINVHSIFRLVKSLVVISKIYKEKH